MSSELFCVISRCWYNKKIPSGISPCWQNKNLLCGIRPCW